jgi:transportin-3
MALRPRFHICAAQALAEREDRFEPHPDVENHEEDAKAIARLFAEVGEAYTDLIAGGALEVMPPVEALLDVASHVDDSICAISFNFWHRLSRALTVGLHPQPLFSEEPAVPKEEADRRLSVFIPTFQRLITLIRGRVRFPNDFSTWHRDEKADFKRARVAVGDTLMDAAAVLGGAETLRLLVEPLMELSARVAAGGVFDWQTAEASLYCVRCVHRAAPPPGDGLLLQLFCALPGLPAPPSLQYTAALTVGAYADWLAETARSAPEVTQLLNNLLDMLVKGLASSESCGACALSLRRVCDGCAPLLASSTPTLLDLYRRVQSSGDISGSSGSDDLCLDEEDVAHVVEAVTLVASALPDGERQACVQRMLDVIVQPMQAILQPWMERDKSGTLGSPDPSQLPLVLPLAERVTTIFRSVRDPGDVGEALVRLWPWLEAALDAFGNDAGAAEKICRVPRYAVRNAGKAAAGAVPVLCSTLPQRFEATAHSCYLYVASELVKTFGDDVSAHSSLEPMLVRLLTAACSALNSLKAVSSLPDVADDTFLLAGRALNYAPSLIITPKILPTLLESVQAGMLVQHRDACSSIAAFMVRLLDPATLRKCPSIKSNHLQAALAPYASNIIRLAMAGSVGALPPSRLQEMTDIIYALLKVASVQGLEWTSQALAAIPDGVLPPSDRQRFIQVCQAVVSDGIAVDDEAELMHALGDLSDCCRRNRKTEAAAQRALLPQELQYIVR